MTTLDSETAQYIQWHDLSNWEATIILGSAGEYYNFKAHWNARDDGWYVTISTLDNIVLIQGRKLILKVDLLANCNKEVTPTCILYPDSDNPNINGITYDNMVTGKVKLFHITSE